MYTKNELEIEYFELPFSTCVNILIYNYKQEELQVTFNSNHTYKYFQVPNFIFKLLIENESIGQGLNALIIGKFQSEKIEPHE